MRFTSNYAAAPKVFRIGKGTPFSGPGLLPIAKVQVERSILSNSHDGDMTKAETQRCSLNMVEINHEENLNKRLLPSRNV